MNSRGCCGLGGGEEPTEKSNIRYRAAGKNQKRNDSENSGQTFKGQREITDTNTGQE